MSKRKGENIEQPEPQGLHGRHDALDALKPFGLDVSSGMVFMTTLLSIVTIPAVCCLLIGHL